MAHSTDLQIRRLTTSDAALYREIRLEALQRNPEAFGSTFEKESPQPLSWFEAALDRAAIFGAFLDGTLAGIAAYGVHESAKQAHKALLWSMYVRPTARNAGLGKRLVGAVLDHARGRVEQLRLSPLGTTESGQRYTHTGFTQIAQALSAGLSKLAIDLSGYARKPTDLLEWYDLPTTLEVFNTILQLRFGRIAGGVFFALAKRPGRRSPP